MAFLDLDAASPFASHRAGVTLRIHHDWYSVAEAPVEVPMPRWRKAALAASALVTAAGLHLYVADALHSQLLGLAATGVIAAIALSLFSAPRR